MAAIKVMGHCPPDTDSTCSPIAYSWFLNTYKGLDTKPYISGKVNKEASFVLNYFRVTTPENIDSVSESDKIVLIDTNNPEELVSGWETSEIVEIVDHHKLYGLKTSNIPTVTVRPYGCVATVIWEIMNNNNVTPTKEIAGLMASCIISDTLNLTSPTTTELDRTALLTLAKIAEIETDSYATQMFDAKSSLEGMSAYEILNSDAKDFNFGEKTYKIGVLETTNPIEALNKISELKDEMKRIIEDQKLTGFLFFVVNITSSMSSVITSSEDDSTLVKKAFNVSQDGEIIELPGVVSRKKQIVPAIEKAVLS